MLFQRVNAGSAAWHHIAMRFLNSLAGNDALTPASALIQSPTTRLSMEWCLSTGSCPPRAETVISVSYSIVRARTVIAPILDSIGAGRPSLFRIGAGSATRAMGSLRVSLLLTDCYASSGCDQSLPERRIR